MRSPKSFTRYWMTSRRLVLFLLLLGFFWCITVLNFTTSIASNFSQEKDPEYLKNEILQLSEKYVRQLAKETENTIDGPYAGRLTGYDLKKTMAVLLADIMTRLDKLEQRVDHTVGNNSKLSVPRLALANQPQGSLNADNKIENPAPAENKDQEAVNMQGLILGKQEDCELTEEELAKFPHCKGKINWMKQHWKSDPCYTEYGVDGSDCSFRLYLSEVEPWCPNLPGRQIDELKSNKARNTTHATASLNLDVEGLLRKLQDPGQRQNYAWIRMRIRRLWNKWVEGAKILAEKTNLENRLQQRVVVHLGLLTKASGWKFAEKAFKGGPLGELVQWSDIIASLYILGHELTITSEVEQLTAFIRSGNNVHHSCPVRAKEPLQLIFTDIVGLRQFKRIVKNSYGQYRILAQFPSAESQCQIRDKLPIDMIYTDIVGLTQFKRKVKNGYGKFSCLLRIIDSFGTEPAFNWGPYAKAHRMKTNWGMQDLNPQQFYTMFPHSPDNSFMGFVVESHVNDSDVKDLERKDQALVYGKSEYMWQGKGDYLNMIKERAEIHGTVYIEDVGKSAFPKFVKNHGILSGQELHTLLRESKLFIGLGFPYEGPAPLEAIAQGAVYINPKFNPPHSGANTKFFKGKPTLRKLTSQHPYAEVYIGEPHVFTVDVSDKAALKKALDSALQAIKDGKVKPYLPYEYTEEGMLQRVNAYIQHQDFCNPFPSLWPPVEDVDIVMANRGKSCKDVCMETNKICEPSHFKRINSKEEIQRLFGTCSSVVNTEDIVFPAFNPDTKQCVLQQQAMLYSCVGENAEFSRFCPCRDFMPGQTALCSKCS